MQLCVMSKNEVTEEKQSRPMGTRAVRKVRGMAAVRRCYTEGGGDCYAKL
jgi:hypothetical protein